MPRPLQVHQLATNPICAPIRLEIPGRALNDLHDVNVTCLTRFGQHEYDTVIENGDIFVLQRMTLTPEGEKIMREMKQAGIVFVYEIDDDLLHLDPESRYARQVPEDYAESIEACMRACQAIQCSTHPLAKVVSAFHPEVEVLANQLGPISDYREMARGFGPLRIGYAAGENHLSDWQDIADAYQRVIQVAEAEGLATETWIMGDQEIFDSLNVRNKRFFPMLPRDQYMQVLGQLHISLVPLADNLFNRSKSDIKYLESAAASTAVLASSTVYGDTIVDRETGMLFNQVDEFSRVLAWMIRHPDEVSALAKNAHKYVQQERSIQMHVHQWANVYKDWRDRLSTLGPRSK